MNPAAAWLMLIAIYAAFTLAAAFVARMKNRDPLTFGVLGLLFGWIGLLIALAVPVIRLENLTCLYLDTSKAKPEVVRGRLIPYHDRLVFTSDRKHESFEVFYSDMIGSRIILKRERKTEALPAKMFGIANLQVIEIVYGFQGQQAKACFSVYETAIGPLQVHLAETGAVASRSPRPVHEALIPADVTAPAVTPHIVKPSMTGVYVLLVGAVVLAMVPLVGIYVSEHLPKPSPPKIPGFTAPQQVTNRASLAGQYPQLAVDRDGSPKVVWSENTGSTDRVCYAENVKGVWKERTLSRGTSDTGSPMIALDPAGNPNVVWEAYDGSATRVYYSKKTGNAWITEKISISDSVYSGCPQIALDEAGDPNVVWEGYNGSTYQIYYARKTNRGWVREVLSVGAAADNRAPRIALGPDGSPSVAWEGHDGSTCHVYYAKKAEGGWSPQKVSADTSASNYDPHLVVGQDGSPSLVWQVDQGWKSEIYYAKKDKGGWALQKVPTGSSDDSGVQLALDKAGNPHIVWYVWDDGDFTVYYARRTRGRWTPERVSDEDSRNNIEPQIALDDDGNPNVVWLGLGRANWSYGVFFASKAGEGWIPVNLASFRSIDANPQVSVDREGHPEVVWSGNEGELSDPDAYQVYWCGPAR